MNRITVVVPVYNVKKYLDRCIQSLLNQSIQDYTIILVDDGSTDGSGELCSEWAQKSSLVEVLHKVNGGLSDARNYGVMHVKSDYVTFVDSDDYVESEYLELLSEGLTRGADLVITHHVQETDQNPKDAVINRDYQLLQPEEALKLLCYEKISTSAWGKLIPTQFVKEDPFPKGKLYEDLDTIYKYIGKASTIAFNTSQSYHYIQRIGSIRKSKWNERCFDVMNGAENLLNYIENNYPDIKKDGIFRYFYSANELVVRAFADENYITLIKPTRVKLKEKVGDLISNRDASIKHKLQFLFMLYFPTLYKQLWLHKKRSL